MLDFILSSAIILAVLSAWVGVEGLYRRFAARHPERGPYREPQSGCSGGCCSCSGDSCTTTPTQV